MSMINCQCMCNKTNEIVDYVKDHDVVALTETRQAIMNRITVR